MHLTRLDFLFWAAGFVLNVVLLFILWYRRRYRTFPFFTGMLGLEVTRTVVLYVVRACCNRSDYFLVFWSFALMDTLVQLGVIYEMASKIFRPMNRWASDLRGMSLWLIGLSITVAVVISSLASPVAHTRVEAVVNQSNLFATTLMAELFVAMLLLSLTSGLPWRSHAGAIAQGLGGYSLLSVFIEAGHTYFGVARGMEAFAVLNQVRMFVYMGCVVYWIVNLNSEEQPSRTMTGDMQAALLSIQTQVAGDLRTLRLRKSK